MKTIQEVLQMFPNTNESQWKQHDNGKGWVFETAHVAASAFIQGIVSGNAHVSDNAHVYGDAHVSGDAWVKSPLYIQGSRHPITLCSRTTIAIGMSRAFDC